METTQSPSKNKVLDLSAADWKTVYRKLKRELNIGFLMLVSIALLALLLLLYAKAKVEPAVFLIFGIVCAGLLYAWIARKVSFSPVVVHAELLQKHRGTLDSHMRRKSDKYIVRYESVFTLTAAGEIISFNEWDINQQLVDPRNSIYSSWNEGENMTLLCAKDGLVYGSLKDYL